VLHGKAVRAGRARSGRPGLCRAGAGACLAHPAAL